MCLDQFFQFICNCLENRDCHRLFAIIKLFPISSFVPEKIYLVLPHKMDISDYDVVHNMYKPNNKTSIQTSHFGVNRFVCGFMSGLSSQRKSMCCQYFPTGQMMDSCHHYTYIGRKRKYYWFPNNISISVSRNMVYSSEIRGLCLMKWPSENLQNLPYFWNIQTHVFLLFFIPCYFIFSVLP